MTRSKPAPRRPSSSPSPSQRSPSLDHFARPPPDHMPPEAADPAVALVLTSLALIDAGLDLLRHIEDDAQLTHASLLIPGGSVGKHFRHVSETFDALLAALEPGYYSHTENEHADADAEHAHAHAHAHGRLPTIDYDVLLPAARQGVARDLDICRASLAKVRAGLEGLAAAPDLAGELARDVDVLAVTPSRQCMRSTLARELWFCALHTIHHYTMIRTICVHELGIALPVEFGTAPATLLLRPPGWKPPAEVWKAKL
ncbi:hypothetical protein CC85DRAFT_282739 [Cutaneotrichosporon oleaginosum]|uniref:DinB-like domain-containing protein n=1 Tax=Cutaneotrichosporon oleaginosum TaxID=879819 RepID=A0A0J0XW06_9TREE|nr:uncharacterized protein CC85DRAFT_282739 [Cutaneotrichosporon oleaginosum]KLT45251.1 hypothetical protein CC85DRAFT_282739 [Cutaneotrichosporon oleaginosum]